MAKPGYIPTVEELAMNLHEAAREAVNKQKLLKKFEGERFFEWNEISEDAREGRRIIARYLLRQYYIFERIQE